MIIDSEASIVFCIIRCFSFYAIKTFVRHGLGRLIRKNNLRSPLFKLNSMRENSNRQLIERKY